MDEGLDLSLGSFEICFSAKFFLNSAMNSDVTSFFESQTCHLIDNQMLLNHFFFKICCYSTKENTIVCPALQHEAWHRIYRKLQLGRQEHCHILNKLYPLYIRNLRMNFVFENSIKNTNAYAKKYRNLLRVVTSPHSLNPPSSGFCRFWGWGFVGPGLSRSYPLTRLL